MAAKVLIVDDSATIRSVVQVYLMDLHLDFVDADNGERALHLLNLMPFDLVIADVKMAPMDGLTFLRKVRESPKPEVRAIPILMLTGDKSPEVRKQGVLFGANEFLLKPINQDQLLETVRRLIEGKQ